MLQFVSVLVVRLTVSLSVTIMLRSICVQPLVTYFSNNNIYCFVLKKQGTIEQLITT